MGTPLDKLPGAKQLEEAAPALGLYNPTVIGASGAPFLAPKQSVLDPNPAPVPTVQAPALAPLPDKPMPTRDSQIVRDAMTDEQRAILQRKGRAATILTSAAGSAPGVSGSDRLGA